MSELSPQAQAVLDAMHEIMLDISIAELAIVAAALRAVADQIEPDDGVSTEVRQVLNKLLAIATELKNHQ